MNGCGATVTIELAGLLPASRLAAMVDGICCMELACGPMTPKGSVTTCAGIAFGNASVALLTPGTVFAGAVLVSFFFFFLFFRFLFSCS